MAEVGLDLYLSPVLNNEESAEQSQISHLSWCSTWAFCSWDLKRTFRATMYLLAFSRAKYTFPNLPCVTKLYTTFILFKL